MQCSSDSDDNLSVAAAAVVTPEIFCVDPDWESWTGWLKVHCLWNWAHTWLSVNCARETLYCEVNGHVGLSICMWKWWQEGQTGLPTAGCAIRGVDRDQIVDVECHVHVHVEDAKKNVVDVSVVVKVWTWRADDCDPIFGLDTLNRVLEPRCEKNVACMCASALTVGLMCSRVEWLVLRFVQNRTMFIKTENPPFFCSENEMHWNYAATC